VRDLSERLNAAQHDHHSLVMATTHVHLDHEHCMENVFLKGPTTAVRAFADGIRAERGVSYGQINLIAVESGDDHRLAPAHHHHGHMHLTPKS
jgi:CopG family nickel-responsive transcriptional regulator